jgi:hypothetical protein
MHCDSQLRRMAHIDSSSGHEGNQKWPEQRSSGGHRRELYIRRQLGSAYGSVHATIYSTKMPVNDGHEIIHGPG